MARTKTEYTSIRVPKKVHKFIDEDREELQRKEKHTIWSMADVIRLYKKVFDKEKKE